MSSRTCSSSMVPSVVTARAWVSPRVNRAEPWVRGRTPISQVMGLISSRPRPSTRSPLSRMLSRSVWYWRSSMRASKSFFCTSSLKASAKAAFVSAMAARTALPRSCFTLVKRATDRRSCAKARISASLLSVTLRGARGSFSLPARARSSSIAAQMRAMGSLAASMAAIISSSETSWEPPSTMVIPTAVPATVISRRALAHCWKVGLTTYWPSICATRTAAMGPAKGMSEMWTAALAATTPIMSGGLMLSAETQVGTTWISLPKALSKRGRIGRSMILETRISLSLGRVSLLMKPPGILPAA